MKLRVKGNSIRLRLLRSELERFSTAGQVSETLEFGPSSFLRYTLRTSPQAEKPFARMNGSEISIEVPETLAKEWASTEMVGFDAEQSIGEGEMLSILVEKDFECLDRPDDPDRADAFPNPSSECRPD